MLLNLVHFRKLIFSAIPVLFLFTACEGQPMKEHMVAAGENVKAKINWMSFEEAVSKSDQNPKKIFIDVYTSWCGWCKKMDASTFLEDTVANYINKNYYAVKLNAETKDTIHFRDKEFKFQPDLNANELAVSLLSGKMGYPSYVLLDEKFTMMTPPVQSYLNKEDLMPIIYFFGENIYKNQTWEEYQSGIKK